MKRLITRTFTSLALAVIGLAAAAPAQITRVVKVDIPFEFRLGDQTFAAGSYSLTQPEQNLVMLRDARGHAVAQALTVGIESNALELTSKLKFDTSNGTYTLTELWDGSDSVGQQFITVKSRALVAKHHSTESREAAEGSQP